MGDDDDIMLLGEGVVTRRVRVVEMASWCETGDTAQNQVDGLIRQVAYAQKAIIIDFLYTDLKQAKDLIKDGYTSYEDKVYYLENLIARINEVKA